MQRKGVYYMKKTLAVILALFVGASSVFAVENSLDVNFAVPLLTSSTTSSITLFGNTTTTKTSTTSTAFGFDISDQFMVSRLLGVKAEVGFAWPSSWSTTIKTSSSNGNNSTNKTSGSYNNCFDINGFIGLALRPYYKKNMAFVVVPGVDLNWYNYKSGDATYTDFHFGFGADLAFNYNVNKDFYLTVSCPLIWYVTENNAGTANDNFKGTFQATPKVGLGYRF